MRKVILGVFGVLVLALPQVAGAAQFKSTLRYAAKFVCGASSGHDSSAGVFRSHYNTIINIQAIRNKTVVAFRATALREDFEETSANLGIPSGFSERGDFDRDEGTGLDCYDIKRVLGVANNRGFVEGFVNVYSTGPLNVVSVLTAEEDDVDDPEKLAVMQLLEASERSEVVVVEYQTED